MNRIKRTWFVMVVSLMVLCPMWAGKSADAIVVDWNVVQITDNASKDLLLDVSNSKVVWAGDEDGDYEIFLYDGNKINGSKISKLTNNTYMDIGARISGANVAWSGYDGDDSEVFLYDGTQITKLTDNTYNDQNVDISGTNVVWMGWNETGPYGGDSDIFFYDGAKVINITNDDRQNWTPRISGSNIAWVGVLPYSANEIFFYDGRNTIQLTDGYPPEDWTPMISGTNVVWWTDNGEILLYDSKGIVQLSFNAMGSGYDISGSNVVWTEPQSGIFLYDGFETVLVDNSTGTFNTETCISGINIAWIGTGPNGSAVFLYDGKKTVQLTNYGIERVRVLRVSDTYVVWDAWDGSDQEIFLVELVFAKDVVKDIIQDVIALNLAQGIENNLDVKLDAAYQALEDLNANNDVAAINALQAFINAVEAQRGNQISEADTDALIVAAEEILKILSE